MAYPALNRRSVVMKPFGVGRAGCGHGLPGNRLDIEHANALHALDELFKHG